MDKVNLLNVLLVVGGFLITAMLGVISFFLKKLVSSISETRQELQAHKEEMSRWRLEVEREYLSVSSFENWKIAFSQWQTNVRDDFKEIFKKLNNIEVGVAKLGGRNNDG